MPEQPKSFKHLVRVANTDLKGEKPVAYALRKIKGVSYSLSNAVCNLLRIDKQKKAGDLTDKEAADLDKAITNLTKIGIGSWMLNRRKDYETGEDKHLLSGDLAFQKDNDIKRLKKIKSYRGSRHIAGLPSRGQRTKSNFRRNKGKVTGVKRKAAKSGRV